MIYPYSTLSNYYDHFQKKMTSYRVDAAFIHQAEKGQYIQVSQVWINIQVVFTDLGDIH